MMRVTLFDYGAGNLHSLAKALAGPGREVRVETDPRSAIATDALILPGVGAFAPAAARLSPGRTAMRDAILGGLPTIGICLGLQLLFEASDEGPGDGLGVFRGRVTRLRAERTPQIGWNTIDDAREPLLEASGLRLAYYANSFVCRADDPANVTAWSTHGSDRFPAVVRRDACVGVQFHPEKSSTPGVRFLDAFLRAAAPRASLSVPVSG